MQSKRDEIGNKSSLMSTAGAIFRDEFMVCQRATYLNNAARTPMASSVAEELSRYAEVAQAEGARKNEWLARVERVRARIATFIGADQNEVAFTKNTSEGINLVAQSLGLSEGENVILCTELEHAANV